MLTLTPGLARINTCLLEKHIGDEMSSDILLLSYKGLYFYSNGGRVASIIKFTVFRLNVLITIDYNVNWHTMCWSNGGR